MNDPIWQTGRNMMKITEAAEALIGTYARAIKSHPFDRFHVDTDDWDHDWRQDEHSWYTIYYLYHFRVYERLSRLASRGIMALGISFYRPEDEAGDGWSGAKRGKLYAGFAPVAKAWGVDSLYVDGAGKPAVGERLSDALFGTREKNGAMSRWFFAVALDAIESREDFVREVLTPVSALLNGAGEELAFAGSSALLRTDQGTSQESGRV